MSQCKTIAIANQAGYIFLGVKTELTGLRQWGNGKKRVMYQRQEI